MTHTALPWAMSDRKVVSIAVPKARYGLKGQYSTPFIVVQPTLYTHGDEEEQIANGEFIVRACNLHDELVSTLQNIAQRERHRGQVTLDIEDLIAIEAVLGKAKS